MSGEEEREVRGRECRVWSVHVWVGVCTWVGAVAHVCVNVFVACCVQACAAYTRT